LLLLFLVDVVSVKFVSNKYQTVLIDFLIIPALVLLMACNRLEEKYTV